MEKRNLVEKKIYEEKAFKIVTDLAVKTIDENTLISIVKYIEPYHYEEIVEERFLSKTCGYPICSTTIRKIPSQKYQISSRLNHVYDISDRKRYCSGHCYKSSKFIESQISKVPIWLRNTPEYIKDDATRPITLLSQSQAQSNKASTSVYHDEYDLKFNSTSPQITDSNSKLTSIDDQVISKKHMNSSKIEQELNSIEDQWRQKYHVKKAQVVSDPLLRHSIFKHTNVNEKRIENKENNIVSVEETKSIENLKVDKFIASTRIHHRPMSLFHLTRIFEEDLSTSDQEIASKYFFIEYIIGRVGDLLTKETRKYINEEELVEKSHLHEERKRIEYLKKCDEFVAEKNVWFSDLTNQETNTDDGADSAGVNLNLLKSLDDNGEAEMLAKLEMMGLKDCQRSEASLESSLKRTDIEVLDDYKETVLKPLPDFKKVQEEAKAEQLKIKEFFIGDLGSVKAKKIKEKEDLRAAELEMEKEDGVFNGHSFKVKGTDERGVEIVRVLPCVDSQSQMEIRRKIFYEKMIKYMDNLLKFSEFSTGDVQFTNHAKNFVFSLKLTNQNILFNTNEWSIVALFMLKILSLKKISETESDTSLSRTLSNLFEQNRLILTILSSFNLNPLKFQKICLYLIQL